MEELLTMSYYLACDSGQDQVEAARLLREYFYCEHEAQPGETCDASLDSFKELLSAAYALGPGGIIPRV